MANPRCAVAKNGNLHYVQRQIEQTVPQVALEAVSRHSVAHVAQVERKGRQGQHVGSILVHDAVSISVLINQNSVDSIDKHA